MSFSVQLSQDLVAVEAGSNTPYALTIINKGTERDQFELEIEGIDPEWKAVPVPVFFVEPGEEHVERVFLRPPRTSDSLAGTYPFVVRIRSLVTGEQRTSQGVLQVKPYHSLSMEVSPKKGLYAPARKHNIFDLTVVNLGNTEHTLQLVGSDPEDACTYEFEQEQITIGPGQQREVSLTVNPTHRRMLSTGRLVGFSVTGRSVDVPAVAATSQAQLEVRSVVSPAGVGVTFLLAVLLALWIFMMPKPPSVALTVNPMRATAGEEITIRWEAQNATHILVTAGNLPIYDGNELIKSIPLKVGLDTKDILVVATKEGQKEATDHKSIEVLTTQPVPLPEIQKFSISSTRVKLGQPVQITYQLANTDKATLAPLGQALDPNLGSVELPTTSPGTVLYQIIAYNKAGDHAVSKTIKVVVYEQSEASIIAFDATPTLVKEADPKTATLSWQVSDAVRVTIEFPGSPAYPVDVAQGERSVSVTAKTTFTLTAYDKKGRTVTKSVTVDVEKPTTPAPDTTSPTSDPAGAPGGITPSPGTAPTGNPNGGTR